jgi:hypothetical protein
MIRALAMISLLAACSFHSTAPGTGSVDASPQVPIDALPTDTLPPNCFGTGLGVRICLSAPPSTELHVTSTRTIDTTGGSPCDPDISQFCVIAGTAVQIDSGSTLGVQGTRPLVLISTSRLGIDGVIDVASHLATPPRVGPGADSPLCHAETAATLRGGGAGGSLGTKGGDGGPMSGAIAGAALVPTTLQGGCKGSDGSVAGGGQLGHGGGSVYLIATSISVNGSINASGESGTGSKNDGRGGGGGGSGGMIVFDAPTLSVAPGARIFANGGGGGEGTGGNDGKDGIDASSPGTSGVGGSGASTGGDGGAGGAGTADGATGGPGNNVNTEGGGGGGGGAGIIKVFRAPRPSSGMVSPPFS